MISNYNTEPLSILHMNKFTWARINKHEYVVPSYEYLRVGYDEKTTICRALKRLPVEKTTNCSHKCYEAIGTNLAPLSLPARETRTSGCIYE